VATNAILLVLLAQDHHQLNAEPALHHHNGYPVLHQIHAEMFAIQHVQLVQDLQIMNVQPVHQVPG
jgi:hypothetical protein